ncbi:MAG: Sialic acid-specific 9-O-acetylesterase [uncultured Phycisphaerae bacterium]|uniref:Sialic acid-specific 9-O-acetylesterase n=1 Tax=uncultured Phycisphaerae bacterium TaxID=904963 RepID=A0A6J4QMW3_9BACT|nr:MAG: Sialic acid-specific 9-O-acetylesterase [uncultured Phycisphaerae bacterium]
MTQRNCWRRILAVAFGCAALCASAARADVKLAGVFTEHMVLQQGIPAPVWGTAAPNEQVTVTVAGQTAQATADAAGKWVAKVPPLKAGGPHELVAKGANEVKVADVMVGEVWIASGQSNMEWAVASGSATDQEKASANYPAVRMFTVQKSVTGKPAADVATPNNAGWVVCTPQSVNAFSAVGYFFAKELHKSLNVPVGIIHTSWGGTPAESWARPDALAADPELKPILDRWAQALAAYPQQVDAWRQAADQADAQGLPVPGAPQDPRSNPWRAGGLYNAMIAPLVPYGIKGAIWYQGESNASRAYQYRKLLPAMIKTWRDAWGQGEFPFLIVQLANFTPPPAEPGDSDWAELREAQAMTAKQPNNGLAVAIDIGDAADIHPRNKEDVGKRLAYVALNRTYGKSDVVPSGPEYESMAVESDKVRLKFKHAAGLAAKGGGAVKGFAVAGEDKKWHWADATIDGESVVVRSDKVARPVAVRYAWAHNPPTNLYNAAGLPAAPFRTDDWKGVTADAR